MESNTGLDHWDVYTPFVLKLDFYSETIQSWLIRPANTPDWTY
jgi:hypothetical protein